MAFVLQPNLGRDNICVEVCPQKLNKHGVWAEPSRLQAYFPANPAVEAQAIDRAHRIGQTRSVFAYRLIAKDTVEEKVLELQSKKRDLADAIIGEDNSLISRMTADDLRLLLS